MLWIMRDCHRIEFSLLVDLTGDTKRQPGGPKELNLDHSSAGTVLRLTR